MSKIIFKARKEARMIVEPDDYSPVLVTYSDEIEAANALNSMQILADVTQSSSSLSPTKPAVVSAKPTPVKSKKRGKKPVGYPRNALSAYNIFFREERKRMLDELFEARRVANDPSTSKIGFQQLAKTIGRKWKTLGLTDRKEYIKAANEDLVRYEREKEQFYKNATQEAFAEAQTAGDDEM